MNDKAVQDSSGALIGARNIILAGFMGSGKTSVGKALAQRVGWKFSDTDRMIESDAGLSVNEIFEKYGEPAFRDMESVLARDLVNLREHVIATGGGFMVRGENREAAARAGKIILLVASPEEIWHRVGQSRHRPLLQVDDPLARIRELLRERETAYAAIPDRVITDGRSISAIVDEIMERIASK